MRLNGIAVIGCDETNVNTGHKGGIILFMELASIDHYNGELGCFKQTPPSFTKFFGWATAGPKEFCRPLGKAIKTYEDLPVAPFSSMNVENMPHNIDRMVLSNEQQYLYDICLAISRDECYSDLALRKPGPVVHSRWLTIAGNGNQNFNRARGTRQLLQWGVKSIGCHPANSRLSSGWDYWVEEENPLPVAHPPGVRRGHQP
ncbi:hypothetical protein AVEN_29467-1, partial [Araneus ventricosus]